MTRLTRQNGTSLIEVLAAVTIFAIVAAGAAVGTITTIKGNATSRGVTAAAALIHDKIEQLRALDPTANPADLKAGAHADANNPLTELGARGGIYRRTWVVTPNSPRRGLSEIVITVEWSDGVPRTLRSATYVCRSATCS